MCPITTPKACKPSLSGYGTSCWIDGRVFRSRFGVDFAAFSRDFYALTSCPNFFPLTCWFAGGPWSHALGLRCSPLSWHPASTSRPSRVMQTPLQIPLPTTAQASTRQSLKWPPLISFSSFSLLSSALCTPSCSGRALRSRVLSCLRWPISGTLPPPPHLEPQSAFLPIP